MGMKKTGGREIVEGRGGGDVREVWSLDSCTRFL